MQDTIYNTQAKSAILPKWLRRKVLQRNKRHRCSCESCVDCIQKKVMTKQTEMKDYETTRALLSVHAKLMERGLLSVKDYARTLAIVLVLLLSSTGLYAQTQRTGVATETQQATVSFDRFQFPPDYFPRFALKTNLLYGATTSLNIGAEFFLNRFLTMDISLGWNPFVHRANVKFAHLMAQPTLRYWIYEPFNGHFLGLSLMYCHFNVSGIRQPYNWFGVFPNLALSGDDGYRFRGNAYSVSIQYGHQWVLSPRWAIEASVNVGYIFFDYQRWSGGWCGTLQGSSRRHYFGPTNAGITLMYIFR